MSNGIAIVHDLIEVRYLHPHPRNDEIYGDPRLSQDFAAFVQDVKENGIHPLIVADDMTIIGGHRRYYAALELGIEAVDAIVCTYATDTDKLAALIADNNVRVKSNWQLANEAQALIGIANERAKERQANSNEYRNGNVKENVPVVEPVPPPIGDGKARDEVGEQLGISGRTVSDMLTVKEVVTELEEAGLNKEADALKAALDKSVKAAAKAARTKKQQSDDVKKEVTASKPTFNDQKNDNIEWARWSWNPVTGCLHDCAYCYARDIANRFYPEKFAPTYHPERLDAPNNTKAPDLSDVADLVQRIGLRNVFTCSMADLFGKWVPAEWIHAVLKQVADNPQWTFLFLTKFPIRMAEFDFPPNTWIGTTVDTQYAVERAEKAFRKIRAGGYEGVAWLSCEPMMERLTFSSLDMFDWVVVGGSSKSTQTPEFKPPFEWIAHLWNQAKTHDLPVYMKTNLGIEQRVREYPA